MSLHPLPAWLLILPVLFFAAAAGIIRAHFCSTGGKWVWGINLQFESCGCKHLDLIFGLFYISVHFGKCRCPSVSEPPDDQNS